MRQGINFQNCRPARTSNQRKPISTKAGLSPPSTPIQSPCCRDKSSAPSEPLLLSVPSPLSLPGLLLPLPAPTSRPPLLSLVSMAPTPLLWYASCENHTRAAPISRTAKLPIVCFFFFIKCQCCRHRRIGNAAKKNITTKMLILASI